MSGQNGFGVMAGSYLQLLVGIVFLQVIVDLVHKETALALCEDKKKNLLHLVSSIPIYLDCFYYGDS